MSNDEEVDEVKVAEDAFVALRVQQAKAGGYSLDQGTEIIMRHAFRSGAEEFYSKGLADGGAHQRLLVANALGVSLRDARWRS